jgi:hypothetical protein
MNAVNGGIGVAVPDTNLPNMFIGNGSQLFLAESGHYSSGAGNAITIQNGSVGMGYNWRTVYCDAPLRVSSNLTFTMGNSGTAYVTGDITNMGSAVITMSGDEGIVFSKTNNIYTGNWLIAPSGSVSVWPSADGALGMGGFVEVRAGASFNIGQNLTLRNVFGGNGTVNASGKTLTIQPCYTNSILYGAGVSPGTNWAAGMGTLSVTGNLAFAGLTNYNGIGSNAYPRVTIKINGSTNDLVVVGNVNTLNNADLEVAISTNVTIPDMKDRVCAIVTSMNDLSGQKFNSVKWSECLSPHGRWAGTVEYGNGYVKVKEVHVILRGTFISLR